MKRSNRSSRRGLLVAGITIAALAAAAGVAYATIPDSGNVYTACMLKSIGSIRLIDTSLPPETLGGHCTRYETELTWNERGPAGADGPPGVPGDKGDTGAQGPQGPAGPSDGYFSEDLQPAVLDQAGGVVTVAHVTLGAGGYYMLYGVAHFGGGNNDPVASCGIWNDRGFLLDGGKSYGADNTIALTGVETQGATTVSLKCGVTNGPSGASNPNAFFNGAKLTAVKVGTLHEN
jgi:hypothetical protein